MDSPSTGSQPNLEKIYRMFSSPNETFQTEIAQMIAKAHFGNAFSQLAKTQEWFTSLVTEWRLKSHSISEIWQPEYSNLSWLLLDGGCLKSQDIARAALIMSQSCDSSSWCWTANEPHDFRLGERFLKARSLELVENANDLPTLLKDGEPVDCNLFDSLQRLGLSNDVVFNNRIANVKHTKVFPFKISKGGWDNQLWLDAVQFMEQVSPVYADWAQRLLTVIVPIEAEDGYQISASYRHRCGEVAMSWRVRPEQMAEIMIHEASHQHFFLAGMLSAYDDGSDQQLYYSPVVKKHRPIRKILLAYHAFANVLLFYRHAHNALAGEERKWLLKESEKIMNELEELEVPLRSTKALTPLGRALWEPLSVQLNETT